MRVQAVLAELERASAEGATRVQVLRAPRGTGRTAVLREAAAALRDRGVAHTLVACEALGGESGAALDLFVRERLGVPREAAGAPLVRALEAALPEANAQAREFFAFVLGDPAAASQTAQLDARARWEGAWGELERWLAHRGAPWALLLDDAHAADAETLGFVELLAKTSQAPGLVVLSVRADELGGLEGRLAALRPTGRLTETALPPLSREALAQRFAPKSASGGGAARGPGDAGRPERRAPDLTDLSAPLRDDGLRGPGEARGERPPEGGAAGLAGSGAERRDGGLRGLGDARDGGHPSAAQGLAERAGGNPLLASFLARLPPGPTSIDAAVSLLARDLPAPQAQVLDVVCLAGGRLPGAVLEASLGAGWREAAEQLAEAGLTTVAATRRSRPGVEVAVRFPRLVEERERAVGAEPRRAWLSHLRAWAEAELTADGRAPWDLRAPLVAPLLALSAGDGTRASLAWELLSRGADPLPALRKAEAQAVGVRRLVLARRIVEEETFRGELKPAIATAAAAQRTPAAATEVPRGWATRLFEGVADGLERWDQLTLEEAALALEVARAEAVAAQSKAEDTRQAFEALEPKLKKLGGPRGGALSMRLARTWCWFAAEILADGPQARRICEAVRARVPPGELALGFYAPAFLRAEQIAHSRGGDPARARALADELIATARLRGDVRDECVAWNARSLLHLRDGELEAAKQGFERSLAIARAIGFRRREAIALHNLGLVLCQLGEDEASLASQRQYLAMSEQIGNLVARAYGPAAMAMVHVRRVDAAAAEPLLTRARKAAEENGWPGLVAWTRLLSGELKLLLWLGQHDSLLLSQARSDLLACADVLEERKANWSEELDPAELFVLLAFAYRFSGNRAQAEAALKSAERYVGESPVCAAWVGAAKEVFAGRRPEAALAALEAGAHRRVLGLWGRLLDGR